MFSALVEDTPQMLSRMNRNSAPEMIVPSEDSHLVRAETRYNANIFGISPHGSDYTLENDTGIIPEAHKNYMVFNIGKTEVYAELWYGTKISWIGVADSATVKPGEKKELDNGGRPYYVTGLKVINKTDTRAIVHCATYDDHYILFADKDPGTFDELKNQMLKQLCAFGLKYVPYVGSGLSGLVSAFWPSNTPSVWEQVQDRVKSLVDQKVLDAISGILQGDLAQYQERITVLSNEISSGEDPANLQVHYMNIAQDLIGFEKKFQFTRDIPDYQNINQYILPHYSATVLMKISFYVIGIKEADKIGLNSENVKNIKTYASRTIYDDKGANKYINDLYEERLEHAYNKVFAEDLFDNMMNVRSVIGTHGLEYIQLWNYMLANLSDHGFYNNVITYSTLFGRQSANIIKEATAVTMNEPLTPSLIDGKRNVLSSVDIYIWRINNGNGPARVGGIKLIFQNGANYTLGTTSGEVKKVEFKGALLNKLEAFGSGAVDSLVFHFSDGRVETVGERGTEKNTAFELKDHHIVSMFVASDNWSLGGQAANISVAYRLIEKSG